MTPHRFHVPGLAPSGATVLLPSDIGHHIRHVLRLAPGTELRLFDGEGHEYAAVIEGLGKREVVARLGAQQRPLPEPALRIVLALAPLKGDLVDLVIQKTTELGVAEIWPVVTTRTDPPGRATLEGARLERWRRIAAGAAAQCGRAWVPRIRAASALEDVLAQPFEGLRLILDPAAPPPSDQPSSRSPGGVLLLVGPAGGFAAEELAAAVDAGLTRLPLGPRTLRAETAAIAAVATVQVLWGDLAWCATRY